MLIRDKVTPAQLLIVSFAAFIGVGTLGFRFLPGLYTDQGLGWTDSLFMATSAVCVTGLSVVDTATYFTGFGQAWLLILMQTGGLGLLTLTSLVMLGTGRRLSLRHSDLVAGAGTGVPVVDVRRLVKLVFIATFTIEALGAALLYISWLGGMGTAGAAWPAVFHAVSAFCNAGFSTLAEGLGGQAVRPVVLGTIMALTTLGALGFLTISELASRAPGRWRYRQRRQRVPLSLHTKLVLAATSTLIVLTLVTFAYFEWANTLQGMPLRDKLAHSAFAAVISRTAGFGSVDFGAVAAPTSLLMMIMMFIGGGPASTAGGIKVTTAALIFSLMITRLRGRDRVSAWNRTVPDETIGRAVGLTVLASSVLVAALFLLVAVELPMQTGTAEQVAFIHLAFEATSALSTGGLSMNATDSLGSAGRLIAVALMFTGRVGLLSIGAAIALHGNRERFRYAYEDVAIG